MKLLSSPSNLSIFLILLIATGPIRGQLDDELDSDEDNWEEYPSEPVDQDEPQNNDTDLKALQTDVESETSEPPVSTSSTSPESELSSTVDEVSSSSSSITDSSSGGTSIPPSDNSTTTSEEVSNPTGSTDPETDPPETTIDPGSTDPDDPTTEPTSQTDAEEETTVSSSVDPDPLTSSTEGLPDLNEPEKARASTWAIVTVSILISFAGIFTALYFLRGCLIRKRREDQKRLLRGSVSSEGFFYGDGSGSAHSDRFHDAI